MSIFSSAKLINISIIRKYSIQFYLLLSKGQHQNKFNTIKSHITYMQG